MDKQTSTGTEGRIKGKPLIRYFDNRWLTHFELLRTPEGIKSKLCTNGLKARIKSKNNDTLEKVLEPKREYKLTKKSNSGNFQGCPDDMIEALNGTNKDLLEYQGGRILKFRCHLNAPKHSKKPIISKEIEVDETKYNQIKNKKQFIQQSFIHAISNQLEVECERLV